MSDWCSRVVLFMVYFIAAIWHTCATAEVSNTDFGMLIYHGSACLFELALIGITPHIVKGKLCDHMEILCAASIAVNAMGWVLYVISFPPSLYDILLWSISAAQIIRLLIPDKYASNHHGMPVFSRGALGRY